MQTRENTARGESSHRRTSWHSRLRHRCIDAERRRALRAPHRCTRVPARSRAPNCAVKLARRVDHLSRLRDVQATTQPRSSARKREPTTPTGSCSKMAGQTVVRLFCSGLRGSLCNALISEAGIRYSEACNGLMGCKGPVSPLSLELQGFLPRSGERCSIY